MLNMLRTKVAALAMGASLGIGVMAVPAAASSGSSEIHTPMPAAGGTTDITLPGIGTLTVTIDTTGAIVDALLAPDPGVDAGTPVVTPEGVQIPVTLADGTKQTVEVSGELEDGVPTIESEVESEDDESEAEPDDESEHDDDSDASEEVEDDDAASPASHSGTSQVGAPGGPVVHD
jgi:hypothetical protein